MSSAGEARYINERTRSRLVVWADDCLEHGIITFTALDELIFKPFALEKGWLGKSEPHTLTSKGFSTAASFLKR